MLKHIFTRVRWLCFPRCKGAPSLMEILTAIPTNTKMRATAIPEKSRRWCRCGITKVKSAITAVLMAIHSVNLMPVLVLYWS